MVEKIKVGNVYSIQRKYGLPLIFMCIKEAEGKDSSIVIPCTSDLDKGSVRFPRFTMNTNLPQTPLYGSIIVYPEFQYSLRDDILKEIIHEGEVIEVDEVARIGLGKEITRINLIEMMQLPEEEKLKILYSEGYADYIYQEHLSLMELGDDIEYEVQQ